jgi:protein SCO1
MKKTSLYLLFFGVLILIFWGLLYKYTDYFDQSKLAKRGVVRPFSFINQDSAVVNNNDIAGKVCIVEYFFTTCEGICPIMNTNMQRVYETFKEEKDFLILSHTCKPEEDSIPLLKAYQQRMKADGKHWIFLTGRKDSLYKMARFSYGIDDPKNAVEDIEDDFLHSQFFAIVDKNGNVRGGTYDGTLKKDVDKLITDVKELLREKMGKTNFTGVYNN